MSRPPQDFGHIRSLDGLRGFAVILVFAYHALGTSLKPTSFGVLALKNASMAGWIGVDLFFVLSGFLITTILLDARKTDNYFKVFYSRRGLRIFPLYYLVLSGSLLLEPGHYSWRSQIFFWLNLSNLPTAFYPNLIGFLAHFWSLAIEEQFYLVWPSLVRWLRIRTMAGLCIGVIASLFIVRNLPVMLRWNAHWPELIYRLTPLRVDTLCGGALLALIVKYRPALIENRNRLRAVFVVSAAIFAVSGNLYTQPHVIRFGYTALVFGFSSLVALALFPGGWASRIFSIAPLRQMGKYSYAFYLFHPFVVNYVVEHRNAVHRGFERLTPNGVPENAQTLLMAVVEFAAVFGLSALSWNFFEAPILRWKKHFRYEPRPEHYLA